MWENRTIDQNVVKKTEKHMEEKTDTVAFMKVLEHAQFQNEMDSVQMMKVDYESLWSTPEWDQFEDYYYCYN